ncbi:hypothetical protein P5V15_004996 [Pogonomyrmex californicus]
MIYDYNSRKMLPLLSHRNAVKMISISRNGKWLLIADFGKDNVIVVWDTEKGSIDIMAQLGGEGLSSFYRLIEDGEKGLANEMKDLFYYAQILNQDENTITTHPMLWLSNKFQISCVLSDIIPLTKKYYAINIISKFIEEITFEEFVRLYINHRPYLWTLHDSINMENPILTREQLMDILSGRVISKTLMENDKPLDEPLTLQEIYTHLRTLMFPKEKITETQPDLMQRSVSVNFHFLPPVTISFVCNIFKNNTQMGDK